MNLKNIIITSLILLSISCSSKKTTPVVPKEKEEGPLLSYLDKYEKQEKDTTAKVTVPSSMNKQEKFNEIMAPLTREQRLTFEKDITDFKLGNYSPYFSKMMQQAQNKMDVALIGLAAVRVDELLKGEKRSSLLNGNVNQTISSIQMRLNKAIESDNPAIKTITFQSMSLEL